MNATVRDRHDRTEKALDDFALRWVKALFCFDAQDLPQWKRTQNALFCFKGLALDDLPDNYQRRIDSHFAQINTILAGYTLQTWDDYQKMSSEDLNKIHKLIDALVGCD